MLCVIRIWFGEVLPVNGEPHCSDPTLGWRLRPGSYSVKPSYTFRHHQVSINEYGLRNRPVSANAASDTKRIVILGDSFTFAVTVPNEKSFPVLLENILRVSGHYEVINTGVPGYGTAQEMLLMKELTGKKVVRGVYLLMISVNDILDNIMSLLFTTSTV